MRPAASRRHAGPGTSVTRSRGCLVLCPECHSPTPAPTGTLRKNLESPGAASLTCVLFKFPFFLQILSRFTVVLSEHARSSFLSCTYVIVDQCQVWWRRKVTLYWWTEMYKHILPSMDARLRRPVWQFWGKPNQASGPPGGRLRPYGYFVMLSHRYLFSPKSWNADDIICSLANRFRMKELMRLH